MKILMMPGKRPMPLAEISNFSGMWRHYLHRELTDLGVEITFHNGIDVHKPSGEIFEFYQGLSASGYFATFDHIIGMSRHFSRIPNECTYAMQRSIKGAVTQVHDGPIAGHPVDTTFSIRDDGPKEMRGATYIGWAADPDLLPIDKGPGLRILIDHKLYHEGDDRSDTLARQALAFKRKYELPNFPVTIRRFCDGGAEDVLSDEPAKPFSRRHVPFHQIAGEYSEAHMFMVTHIESLGLSVLESAVAGALVVAPEGYIRPDRIQTVRSLQYQGSKVPFDLAIAMLDPPGSRAKAIENSWRSVAQRVYDYLAAFKK